MTPQVAHEGNDSVPDNRVYNKAYEQFLLGSCPACNQPGAVGNVLIWHNAVNHCMNY